MIGTDSRISSRLPTVLLIFFYLFPTIFLFFFLRYHFSSCASFASFLAHLEKGRPESTQSARAFSVDARVLLCQRYDVTMDSSDLKNVENSKSSWKKVALSKFESKAILTALNSFFLWQQMEIRNAIMWGECGGSANFLVST